MSPSDFYLSANCSPTKLSLFGCKPIGATRKHVCEIRRVSGANGIGNKTLNVVHALARSPKNLASPLGQCAGKNSPVLGMRTARQQPIAFEIGDTLHGLGDDKGDARFGPESGPSGEVRRTAHDPKLHSQRSPGKRRRLSAIGISEPSHLRLDERYEFLQFGNPLCELVVLTG